METKRQLRVRIRILAVLAIVGALGTGIGLWLLIAPIHYIAGESCGSVFAPSFPANDDSAVSSCIDLRGGHREDGWFLVGIGLVGLVGGGRAAYLRRIVDTAPSGVESAHTDGVRVPSR